MSKLDKLKDLGEKDFGLVIHFKDESLFMKLLGKILFFNPRFMTNYTTTIGSAVYFPRRKWLSQNQDSAAHVLAHELVHIGDSKEVGSFIFSYTYLFPQVISLLALLSLFFTKWWLLCLLFLLPIPAPFRAYWELRGYAITDATYHKSSGQFTDIDWLASQFVSSSYFFMWPFKNDIVCRLEKNRHFIKRGELSEQISFAEKIIKCFEA